MKKNIWIWALAATTLFAACSSNDNDSIIENPVTDNDFEGPNGQVVIQLGGGESVPSANTALSRVPITDDNFTNETTSGTPATTVGIFALATETSAWTSTDGILLNNVQGIVTKQQRTKKDGADIKTPGQNPYKISLYGKDANGTNGGYGAVYYYPMKVNYNYSFYGYAPYQATGVTTTEANHTVIFNNLDGSQDILWQYAEANTIPSGQIRLDKDNQTTNVSALSGYNAKYIRQLKYHNEIVGESGTTYPWVPNIKFDHKLVQLKFQIIAAKQQASTDKAAAENLTIKDIKIANHGTSATLDFISGAFTCPDVADQHLEMRNINNGVFEDGKATGSYQPENPDKVTQDNPLTTRGYLLAKPAESYQLQMTIVPPADATNPSPAEQLVTITLKNNSNNGDNQFKAGYSYNIQIGIYAMQEAMADASLTSWTDFDEPIYTPVE